MAAAGRQGGRVGGRAGGRCEGVGSGVLVAGGGRQRVALVGGRQPDAAQQRPLTSEKEPCPTSSSTSYLWAPGTSKSSAACMVPQACRAGGGRAQRVGREVAGAPRALRRHCCGAADHIHTRVGAVKRAGRGWRPRDAWGDAITRHPNLRAVVCTGAIEQSDSAARTRRVRRH